MSWFAVSHWQRHGYWSQLAGMTSPEYSEITSVSPVDTDPLGSATYRQGDRTRARASCERALTQVASGCGSTTAPPLSPSASPRRPTLGPVLEPNSLDSVGSSSR